MKRFLKNTSGFTLVELMVVVAIIGILSSVAVPQFRKYQAKAKQSEAKIALSAIYQTEVTALADYDTYATCIVALGMEVPSGGYYVSGFYLDFSGGVSAGGNAQVVQRGLPTCIAGSFVVQPAVAVHKKVSAGAVALIVAVQPVNVINAATFSSIFTAGASGSITAAVPRDDWTIDNSKNLVNSSVGY